MLQNNTVLLLKVALWTEVDGPSKLITAANFCSNGKFAVVGTYDGRCIFYNTDQLKYHTTIDVRWVSYLNAYSGNFVYNL